MKKKRKRTKKRGSSSLNGIPSTSGNQVSTKEAIGYGTLAAIAGLGGAAIGSGIGMLSFPIGLASVIYGVKRNDKYSKFLIAAGMGMIAATPLKKASADEQTEGFSPKSMMNRTKSYFEALKEKVLLIPFVSNEETTTQTTDTGTSTNGLNGEQVTYFVNPYTSKSSPAMNQLDQILQQVEQVKTMEGMPEIDPAMKNF
jgi:hypothetical protein